MKNIKIRDLAKELQLSVSTVSKALHGSYEISEETKQRVMETAARLNYVPNPYASSLRGRKSRNIGVVIPEVADSFFSLAINGIESVAKEKGYHVLICLTHENYDNEKKILQEFQGGRVDGVLMSISAETIHTEHIDDLMINGTPVVFFDRVCENVQTAKVTTDDEESSYSATKHLIEQGADRLAFIGTSSSLSIINKRMDGYKRALDEHSIKLNRNYIISCDGKPEQDYNKIKQLLSLQKSPNGIVASVEKLITPIYRACAELKLRMPEEIKLVCFSNVETASILVPSLTTVTQPAFEMGKKAASLLIEALEKTKVNLSEANVVMSSMLDVRNSSRSFYMPQSTSKVYAVC